MRRLAVAVLVVGLSGCGTAANTLWWAPFEGGQRVYGGVRAEVGVLRDGLSGKSDTSSAPDRAGLVLIAADLPLSAVGDTLTLPYTIPTAILNQVNHRDKLEPTPEPADPSAKPFSPP
jgi:uncharacterized protein YceK